MKPDTSRWRDDHSYDFFDDLAIEGLAWECLRRDEHYQRHYLALVQAKMHTAPLAREAELHWGLRFRGASWTSGNRSRRPLVAVCRSRCGDSYPVTSLLVAGDKSTARRSRCAAG